MTSSVTVTVKQTLTSVVVKPATSTVQVRKTLQFSATALDQFSQALTTQPTIKWTLSGLGTLSSKGLYTAPRSRGGPYSIIATAGSVRGVAKVTVVS
ncbi:MAG: hypothetical protein QM703_07125 [Gemmatales bacterium]